MSIQLEVRGDYALFTRPEMKVERVSYDVMTPSAARGLAEAIYWHPWLRWIIDRIHVCAPIRFTNLRRNEVKSTLSARSARTVMERGKGEKSALEEIKELYGFDANAIVSMAEVVEHLYNREYKGQVVINDTIKAAIDAYYEQYGVK